jgi:ABC-type uncharacterized transport system permease subunit
VITIISCAVAAAAAYLASARQAWRNATGSSWTPLALVLHLASLYLITVHDGEFEIGVTAALSLLAWQSALLLWGFSMREKLHPLGGFYYPAAAVLAVIAAVLPTRGNSIPLDDWTIDVHIALSILSAGVLTLASIHAVAIAGLDQVLRNPGNLAMAQRMPTLQTMEHLLFQLIKVGFFLLSLTILSGLLFVHDLFGQHLAQKTFLTLCAWLIFGTLLWGRTRYGWRGRIAIRWTLLGYAMLVAAYIGSKLILEQFLGEHWT